MNRSSVPLLIVESQATRRLLLRRLAEAAGFEVQIASGTDFAEFGATFLPEAVLLDPDSYRLLESSSHPPSWWSTVHKVLSAPASGSSSLPTLGPSPDAASLREALGGAPDDGEVPPAPQGVPTGGFLTRDPRCKALLEDVRRLANSPISVLITGESGTGKELVARALHLGGPRRRAPFVAINCSAIAGELLESEFFGHERGAFTDAHRRHAGCFERAGEGTLFLDEIGDLPLELQPKLLRVLESRRFTRVGGEREVEVRARVIAATHRDLPRRIEEKVFRPDLYHRLAVATLRIPPLRERPLDLHWLSSIYLRRFADELEQPPRRISAASWKRFLSHDWPGNVRELENFLHRSLLVRDQDPLDLDPRSADDETAPRWIQELRTHIEGEIRSGRPAAELREEARRAVETLFDPQGASDNRPVDEGDEKA